MIGMAMAKGLEERGQVGATHMGTGFDAWYPGYIDYKPVFQNISSFWTETALYSYATPRFYTLNDFPPNMRDLRPQALYTSPWPGGWWRLRDAVEYMETASLSVLDYASRYREHVLLNRYRAGRWQIDKYTKAPPHAYFVPQQQRDPAAAVELLRRLAFQGVRVSQLKAEASVEGDRVSRGHLGDSDGSGVRGNGAPGARRAALSRPARIARRPARTALRRRRLDTAVPDGRVGDGRDDAHRGRPAREAVRAWHGPSVAGPVTPYDTGPADAAPFDSAPGVGFETSSLPPRSCRPPGRSTGTGPALALDPAQNNTFAALNRAWAIGCKGDGARRRGTSSPGWQPRDRTSS